jgi:hypothetical protein
LAWATNAILLLPPKHQRRHNQIMSESTSKTVTRYFVNRTATGEIRYNGVDKGGAGTVLAENDKVLVVEWPSGKNWVGRGMQPAYHPASTDVLRKDEDGRCTLLISWEKLRSPRRKAAIPRARSNP